MSCYPRYFNVNDFATFIRCAMVYINCAKNIWTTEELQCLTTFLNNLIAALENTTNPNSQLPWGNPGQTWAQNPAFINYYCRVRAVIGQSDNAAEIYALAGAITAGSGGGIGEFAADFGTLSQLTQQQLAHLYIVAGLFWAIYNGETNAINYLNRTDFLLYAFQNTVNNTIEINCAQMACFQQAVSKIFFVGESVSVPSCSLIVAFNSFTVLDGTVTPIGNNIIVCENNTYECGVYISGELPKVQSCNIGCMVNGPCGTCASMGSCQYIAPCNGMAQCNTIPCYNMGNPITNMYGGGCNSCGGGNMVVKSNTACTVILSHLSDSQITAELFKLIGRPGLLSIPTHKNRKVSNYVMSDTTKVRRQASGYHNRSSKEHESRSYEKYEGYVGYNTYPVREETYEECEACPVNNTSIKSADTQSKTLFDYLEEILCRLKKL